MCVVLSRGRPNLGKDGSAEKINSTNMLLKRLAIAPMMDGTD